MRIDDAADRLFAPARGNPTADRAALVVSNVADYGFVWSVIAALKGRWRALAVAGALSSGVNAACKRVFRRERPPGAQRTDRPIRTPTSTSFPSGHTLAAYCTAVILADSPVEWTAYLAIASAVAISRVHLEAHHATDVIGGAVIGTAAGMVGRALLLP